MIKAFLGYLLSLCILLVSAQSVLYASISEPAASHSPAKKITTQFLAQLDSIQHSPDGLVRHSAFLKQEEDAGPSTIAVYNSELEEEDEAVALKKQSERSSYITLIFFALSLRDIPGFSKTSLVPFSWSSYNQSDRYLLLQVFRI